ncbi:glycosyltransferase [Rhodococcus fascians]|uniref:glycosyltransferase family 2 protein n=1 Tax=Rhodococcoides fascians TaxID=1828 RepID=UPI00195BCD4F|nr:glycosyltransferase [Rhodococcus fascians]MBM7241915.1 glycosyltransferase [Rhodococcus fascians]MBY3808619.1 glycosyltransferase [Rhodococcus fascians]MBY3840063.1 glycosyltransferase [Rhodococcus fascians]MBY3845172.1 glycosyltransferase [Rhodococcus fascians]MBY3848736.1 glycosyltransferase [Rhodococcus fascians]
MSSSTTVVVVTRNRAAELGTTLSHLARLRPRPPVVVVDNASSDETERVVAEASTTSEPVSYIRLDHNGGGASRNVGVRAAATPYVAFSDDDSWWEQGALPRAEQVFDRYPGVGLIAARTLVGHDNREDPVNALMANSPLGQTPDSPGPSILGFIACGTVVRTRAFEQAGGFSELIGFAGEEESLALDLATAGYQLCYVDSIINHHHPSTSRASPHDRISAARRNEVLTAWMRRPLSRASTDSAKLVLSACSDTAARRALVPTLQRLPSAIRRRRPVPPDVERRLRLLEGWT